MRRQRLEGIISGVKKIGMTLAVVGLVAGYVASLPYRMVRVEEAQKRHQLAHAELIGQNPVFVRREKSMMVYGFNNDSDPEIDRVVKMRGVMHVGHGGVVFNYRTDADENDPRTAHIVARYNS